MGPPRTPEPRAARWPKAAKQLGTVVKPYVGRRDGEIELLEVGEVVVIKVEGGTKSRFLIGYARGERGRRGIFPRDCVELHVGGAERQKVQRLVPERERPGEQLLPPEPEPEPEQPGDEPLLGARGTHPRTPSPRDRKKVPRRATAGPPPPSPPPTPPDDAPQPQPAVDYAGQKQAALAGQGEAQPLILTDEKKAAIGVLRAELAAQRAERIQTEKQLDMIRGHERSVRGGTGKVITRCLSLVKDIAPLAAG